MSCLWTWCCPVHEDASDMDSKGTEEQQIEMTKKGKKKRRRSQWRIHWKKERKNNFNKDEETEKDQRLINQQPAKVEEEAHVLGLPVGLASSLESVSAGMLEATAPPPQDNLTKEEDAAVQHLMETLLEEVGTCMEQLLTENEHMDTNLAEIEEETVEKHLDHLVSSNNGVADAIRELIDIMFDDALSASLQPLDLLVSPKDDTGTVIRELLDILFDDALSASLQPLENEQMDTNLDKTEEETVEKHLDHLVSSNNGVADAIRELIDIMFDDALSASLQPLENEQMDTNLEKTEEETVEKHLDHLVSSNKDAADAIRELLEIMFDDVLSASLQPLEKDVISLIEAETQPEATENRLNVCLEESQAPENQCLNIEKSHRPEEEKTKKKKTRRGTRGKGRKIFYKKEKYPHDKLDGQRGSSGQTNNVKNCGHESRELVHPRRVHSEWDGEALQRVSNPGDVVIGGLFPIHNSIIENNTVKPTAWMCDLASIDMEVLLYSQAMIYSIEKINNSSLLPEVKIGYKIYDTCSSVSMALSASLDLMNGETPDEKCLVPNDDRNNTVKAVIGERSSEVSVAVARLLALPLMTQVTQFNCSKSCKPGFEFYTLDPEEPCCKGCKRCEPNFFSNDALSFSWGSLQMPIAGQDCRSSACPSPYVPPAS
ncbi:hypothetical protein MHYP_G00138070 [Metynnis hypsauchen]